MATRAERRRRPTAHRASHAWHPAWLRRGTALELGEWLTFAVLRDPGAESTLRSLLESFELFAACEGLPEISELAFVRQLERLGVRRRGATFLGLRVYSAVPALRLLTRLGLYGFRFAVLDGELLWQGPEVVTDLERRVIARHRRDLVAALRQIEATRALLRGESALPRPLPARSAARRAA